MASSLNRNVMIYPTEYGHMFAFDWSTWGRVAKPISSVPLFSLFFGITKTHVNYWISRSYLTGVAAAELRWHLSNMNVIEII